MQIQFERELLKTLKSIDGTLKRIEKSVKDEEKKLTITGSRSFVMLFLMN